MWCVDIVQHILFDVLLALSTIQYVVLNALHCANCIIGSFAIYPYIPYGFLVIFS